MEAKIQAEERMNSSLSVQDSGAYIQDRVLAFVFLEPGQ